MKTKTKFQIGDLLPIGITLVVLGIGLAFGLEITGDVQNDVGTSSCSGRTDGFTTYSATSKACTNSTGQTSEVGSGEWNATVSTISGVSKLPAKLPIIVTVIVAAVLIGILVRYLMVR